MSSFGVGNQIQDLKSTIAPGQTVRAKSKAITRPEGAMASHAAFLLNKPQWPGSDNKLNHDMGYRLQLLDLD